MSGSSELKPFTTDGCSGGMSLLWRKVIGHPPPWEDLCVEHDRAYHVGGHTSLRRRADRVLAQGIADCGHPVWAVLVYVGVRLGGAGLLPTPWRWGYGWRWPRHRAPGGQS